MSSRALLAFDCQEEKKRFVQVETFSESGLKKSLLNFQPAVNWTYIRPQTIEESLFELVCGKK
jgi:hypothetical protein